MRGVLGLALIIIGASMGWLITLGKFPPSTSGKGILAELSNIVGGAASGLTAGKPATAPGVTADPSQRPAVGVK